MPGAAVTDEELVELDASHHAIRDALRNGAALGTVTLILSADGKIELQARGIFRDRPALAAALRRTCLIEN